MTQQLALPIRVRDTAQFSNFFAGPNGTTLQSLSRLFDSDSWPLDPIFLAGHRGTGKSHLLYAVANRLECLTGKDDVTQRLSYLALSDSSVSAEMLETLAADQLVLLDDVNVWAGNLANEQALFALYERVKRAGGGWLASSSASADAVGFKLPDLISRLSSGLQFKLEPLSEDERMEALKLRARHRGFTISEEPVRYLVKHFARDMHSLFELLETMDEKTLQAGRKVTVPFLKEILS
ncbi:MAG TPA: DnaA regulatory inactivator Hda [Gammaproteobacteria bacterium]|jgi:DnaA-homolog protein|nr:DnaA regulatory inactivator Hda [Pseudomonadota bacterium]HAY45372.1 DnaA regulatory inactivator Hda [Gammaproteobacteria bacterium]